MHSQHAHSRSPFMLPCCAFHHSYTNTSPLGAPSYSVRRTILTAKKSVHVVLGVFPSKVDFSLFSRKLDHQNGSASVAKYASTQTGWIVPSSVGKCAWKSWKINAQIRCWKTFSATLQSHRKFIFSCEQWKKVRRRRSVRGDKFEEKGQMFDSSSSSTSIMSILLGCLLVW